MVGVMDVVGSTNIAMKKGFEALGYEVDAYNYRTVQAERGIKPMWLDFMASLRKDTYDLIVFCKTNSIPPMLLDEAREYAPTWYWFMDNMWVCKQISASIYAQNATFASATASDVADRFKSINKNSHHIFEGYDPDVYFYEDLKKIHDVIFIGNATIPRIIEISNLRSAGVYVSVFGRGWPFGMNPNAPVFGEDERTEINQSKVVLNLCHDDVIFSDRVTKALGCGAKVVSQRCKDLLDFELGDWVNLYGNAESFKEVAELTVSGPKCISETTKINYSWEAVCRGMLKKVEEYCEY